MPEWDLSDHWDAAELAVEEAVVLAESLSRDCEFSSEGMAVEQRVRELALLLTDQAAHARVGPASVDSAHELLALQFARTVAALRDARFCRGVMLGEDIDDVIDQ